MIFKLIRTLLISITVLTLCACQNGSSNVTQGITVSLNAQLTPTANSNGLLQIQPQGSKQFNNSENIAIRIKHGYLVLASVTLESDCNNPDFAAAEPWWSWFIASAHAHTQSTPLQLGKPMVIDLTAEELQTIELGTLTPPPGDYCGTTAQLLSADADADGLPVTVDMIGRSLYIEGEYSNDNGQNWAVFQIDSSINLLPARRIFPLSLNLSNEQRSGSINLSIAYQDWFNGIDLSALDDTNQLNQVFFNVTESIGVDAL